MVHGASHPADVVVAGGGVAGLTAAVALAQNGLRVRCIEPTPSPRSRVGESLDWSAPQLLDALGMGRDVLVAAGDGTYKRAVHGVTRLITAAVIFDVSATACMMIGTTETYFTAHGILGYTALAVMVTDAILIWRHRAKHGHEVPFSKGLHRVSLYGYMLWVCAFLTGEYLAFVNMGN